MDYKEFFGCKYPIIAASMNQISDLNLAIACFQAGIMPSLPLYSYSIRNYVIDYDTLNTVLKEYTSRTGSNKIIMTTSRGDLLSDAFLNFVLENNIKFVEVIANDEKYSRPEKPELFKENNRAEVKIIPKITHSSYINPKLAHAVMLKNKDGAGRGLQNVDPVQEINFIKNNFPSLPMIMSGGIGTSADIKKYLNLGCMAVAIGTLFAASEESCVSRETKEKMVAATYNDVKRFEGSEQNALIFSKLEKDDFNHTNSLIEGIKDPSKGHIFAGKGIDQIKSILPVKDIVQLLVDGL